MACWLASGTNALDAWYTIHATDLARVRAGNFSTYGMVAVVMTLNGNRSYGASKEYLKSVVELNWNLN